MSHFILYGTTGCHLCELAEAQLASAMEQLREPVEIECVDIADSDELVERYGVRIPVLRRARDAAEMDWPFPEDGVLTFLHD
jgi:thiol-disulfide isomerase/thioredoxin